MQYDPDELPVVLAVATSAATLDTLFFAILRQRLPVRIVAVFLARLDRNVADGLAISTQAEQLWGDRCLRAASKCALLGAPLWVCKPRRQGYLAHVLGLTITTHAAPNTLHILLSLWVPYVVKVVTQGGAAEEVGARVAECVANAAYEGMSVEKYCRPISPGHDPNMHGPGIVDFFAITT